MQQVLDGMPAGSSLGGYPRGTYPGGGGLAGTRFNSENDNGNYGTSRSVDALRRRWDVLPEVGTGR